MNLSQNKMFNIFLMLIFGVVTIYYVIRFFNQPQNQLFNFIAVVIGLFGVWLSFRDYKKSQKANSRPASGEVKSQNEDESLP